MRLKPRVIELKEFRSRETTRKELPLEAVELLCDKYPDRVKVEATSFRPGSTWKLTSRGYVGYLPLTPDLGLRLLPKVPIDNIFRMLEYAYDLKIFSTLDELTECASMEDFYDRLARLLATQVLNRARKGFYRAYQPRHEQLPFIRGRLDFRVVCQRPWDPRPACHFEEHTADVAENRILAWTLRLILSCNFCTNRSLPLVRQAHQMLAGCLAIQPCDALECIGRTYNRLNYDYEPMHALCRFFLENCGPGHEAGNKKMIPFLINMERLFELFVARWLEAHLPKKFLIRSQERIEVDPHINITFKIDISIFDMEANSYALVMDTKYKLGSPSTSDIQQVVAYAEAKDCREAILIYPDRRDLMLNGKVGRINVRSVTFPLDANLEIAGEEFVKDIFGIEA